MPHRSRMAILLLDLPPDLHRAGAAFWAGVTGREATPSPSDDAWIPLGTVAGGFSLEVQRTGRGRRRAGTSTSRPTTSRPR